MINPLNKKRFAKDLKGVICFCNGNFRGNCFWEFYGKIEVELGGKGPGTH